MLYFAKEVIHTCMLPYSAVLQNFTIFANRLATTKEINHKNFNGPLWSINGVL